MVSFPPPDLPEGRHVDLPGRGTTFVREVAGPPGAPVVMLLHGWTANSALNWYPTFTPLSQHYRVLAVDHRGHGRGIRSRQAFSLEACADDVAALADALDVRRMVAVGYSMGGPVAQLLWHRHRWLVSGLVLCATARNFVGASVTDRAFRGVVTGLSFVARATAPTIQRRVNNRMLVARYDDSPLGQWARSEARLNDLRALVEAGRAIGGFSSREWIGGVDVPTAVVLTERDLVVPPVRQQKLADAIPWAAVHRVPGGHDVCATEPELFVPALRRACQNVVARAAARSA